MGILLSRIKTWWNKPAPAPSTVAYKPDPSIFGLGRPREDVLAERMKAGAGADTSPAPTEKYKPNTAIFGLGRPREDVLAERMKAGAGADTSPAPTEKYKPNTAIFGLGRPREVVLAEREKLADEAFDIFAEAFRSPKFAQTSSSVPAPPHYHDLSPLGEACSRMDLTAIHQVLMMMGYKDDINANKFRFVDARRRGDSAFSCNDFKTAVECYSQFIADQGRQVPRTVYERRSLCYLMHDQANAAFRDAMQALHVDPDWPTALYLGSVALVKLDKAEDAANMLNKAAQVEKKRL